MKQLAKTLAALSGMVLLAAGCNAELETTTATQEEFTLPEYLVVSLPGEELNATKAEFVFEDGTIKGTWNAGDVIAVTSGAGFEPGNSVTYTASTGGARTTVFQGGTHMNGSYYRPVGVYFPGDRIQTDAEFNNFLYTGQVQDKANPTAHLASYYTMRKLYNSYITNNDVSFENAQTSSVMRLNLSGMTFNNPTSVTLTILGNGTFYLNNDLTPPYYGTGSDVFSSVPSKSISVDLTGYSSETSLVAYIAMSCIPVELTAGDVIKASVTTSDGEYCAEFSMSSNYTLQGGYCHKLTFNEGWALSGADHTVYPYDGDVVTLQTHTIGKGIDLVIMGDGFVNADFTSGLYENIMTQTMEEFFSVEPLTSFRSYFDVYYVKAVSPQRLEPQNIGINGADNSGNETKFNVQFTQGSTSIGGDNNIVREYALHAISAERIKDATIVVIANGAVRAGTCYNSWDPSNGEDYGQACAIAYSALGHNAAERVQLMHHEIDGHGFGKLADEYVQSVYTGSFPTSEWTKLQSQHSLGLFRNADKYVSDAFKTRYSGFSTEPNTTSVLWSDMFGKANNYESAEALGIFEGGKVYQYGFCRPTENGNNSIMNHNTGIFNAISRRQIYYRIMSLSGRPDKPAGKFGTAAELNDFLTWDAANFHYPSAMSASIRLNSVEIDERLPFAPPVLIEGTWSEDGIFTPLHK